MTATNRRRQITRLDWMTDPQAVPSRARQHGRRVRHTSAVAALSAAVACVGWATHGAAMALPPLPVERVGGDTGGGSTEHYSIDHHGSVFSPTGFVSVGMRTLSGGGRGLHIVRYDPNYVPLLGGEVLLLPAGMTEMVGFSVDTMANGDLLIAGKLNNVSNPLGLNVFVCRMNSALTVIRWNKLLRGTYNEYPSVTARELRDGTIIVAHNEGSDDPNADLGPAFGHLTRLTANGGLVWSRRYAVPNAPLGQLRFADVREGPQSGGGHLWVAGSASPLLARTAMLLELDPNTGEPVGECGSLYPHPAFENTSFASLYIDQLPGATQYSIVAAGTAVGLDIADMPQPRVVDVSATCVPPNWDHVYGVYMTPAPTAMTLRWSSTATRIFVAGTEASSLSSDRRACLLSLDATASGAFLSGRIFGNGTPLNTAFNDIADSLALVGGRQADVNGDGLLNYQDPVDVYFVGGGGSSCSEGFVAATLGPGTWTCFCPASQPDEQMMDWPLMGAPVQSDNRIICRYKLPNPDHGKAFRWP